MEDFDRTSFEVQQFLEEYADENKGIEKREFNWFVQNICFGFDTDERLKEFVPASVIDFVVGCWGNVGRIKKVCTSLFSTCRFYVEVAMTRLFELLTDIRTFCKENAEDVLERLRS